MIRFRIRSLMLAMVLVPITFLVIDEPHMSFRNVKLGFSVIAPNAYTGQDEFECELVNNGVLPLFIQVRGRPSREFLIWVPIDAEPDEQSVIDWIFQIDLYSGIRDLEPMKWVTLYHGDSIALRRELNANLKDQRLRLQVEVSDFFGREVQLKSAVLRFDKSSGKVSVPTFLLKSEDAHLR